MKSFKKSFLFVIVACSFMLILAACSDTAEESTNTEEPPAQEEVTVTDATGEVTIPTNAERIIAPYMEDSLLSLDITPAAQWSIGTTVLNYLQEDLTDIPTIEWNLPLEMTIEADPDLLIFQSQAGMAEGASEEYEAIAPTYVFKDEEGTDWRKQIEIIGTLTGNEEKAATVLADYDTHAVEASAQVNELIGDGTAAVIWVFADQFYLFEENRHAANVLYSDLGIAVPEFVKNLGPAQPAAWNPISLEALANLDADHVFLVANEGEPGVERLNNSTVWQGLPAAQNDQVYVIPDTGHWTLTGNIANRLTIDKVLEALSNE
ncbi:ABC transporter substrate-binding protein [Jeotgalibacillus soli]|uniref:Ferrichrome ABC transporter substrate-binding protein n=1 Tax=Jeotgalibacillus soli TaxID=889306 RepID=A0A0C2VJX5_9BACL|nr:ABC transporter substrate-binding protein [Jeotgalibacillus soli]KIL44298.1 ferrichrome ABC transporter substrate-binding protein [Jeotgalibacillus soli]